MGIVGIDSARSGLRALVGIAGVVYFSWWFMVELLLPGSFNPLPGRLLVVALSGVLLGASYRSRWVASRLSLLFTAWVCLLVAHYCYLLIGNHGESTWWIGAFVTFATVSMCLQSPREVAAFSVFALGAVLFAAAAEGQLRHSIYRAGPRHDPAPRLRHQAQPGDRARGATSQAERARSESRRADEQRFQLAAIVESSGDAIVANGPDGRIQSWNKGAERLFGYAAEDVIGRPISLLVLPGARGDEPALVAAWAKGEPPCPSKRCGDARMAARSTSR